MIWLPLPRKTRPALPTAALVVALATCAHAQGTDEQREACTPDALKLCSDTIPDVGKTTACMKAHKAALSPRCRAVFNEPAMKEPAVAAASKAVEAHRERRRERVMQERDEAVPSRHRPTTQVYADPLRGSSPDDVGGDARAASGGAAYDGFGVPDIRHFAPGDGPDEVEAGPPPYGYGGYEGGPRYPGPRAWDGPPGRDGPPRFADRDGPDDYDEPGPHRGRPADLERPPPVERDDVGPGGALGRRPRGGRHAARAVIARLCERGEIDPRSCAETLRALERRHE